MTDRDPPDSSRRRGEALWHLDRSGRSFIQDGNWFFRTREGIHVGPYQDQDAAETAAELLSTMLDGISDAEITRQFVKEFMLLKE